MSKVKKTGLSHYEMLFIVPNKYTEDEADKIVAKVRDIIKDNGGNITFSEDWGKKRLSYKIDDYNHGYYNLFEFDLEGNELEKIDRTLRMHNDILRHQIIKMAVKTSQQIEKEKKIAKKIADKVVKKEKEKEKEEEVKKEKDIIKDKDKGKLELKDLDKKLDKILDTDDLL